MEITILQGQSLFDLAVQHTGSIESVFNMAAENNMSLTDQLQPGKIIQYTGETLNSYNVFQYNKNDVEPATALTQSEIEIDRIFNQEQFSEDFE